MEQVTEQQVRESIATASTHLEKAAEQIVWQVQNKAWLTLGYASWDEMREKEYGKHAVMVPRADRLHLVSGLRKEGLTITQIADTIGVGKSTVGRLNSQLGNESQPDTVINSRGQERPTTYSKKSGVSANAPTPEEASAQLDDYLKRRKDEREEQFISAKGEQYVWGEVETLVGVARLRLTEARERAVRLTDPDNPRTDGIDRAKRAIAKLEIELSTLKSLVGDTDWDALLREEQ